MKQFYRVTAAVLAAGLAFGMGASAGIAAPAHSVAKPKQGHSAARAKTAPKAKQPKARAQSMGHGFTLRRAAEPVYYRPYAVQKPRPYEYAIHQVASKYHLPDDLVHAVVNTESGYNPRTLGGVGEIGLMQIRPATARLMGYAGPARGLYNPAVNLEYGTRYLAMAHYLSGGSVCGTVLKYNAGHGATRMNPISYRYCQKVKTYLYSVGSRYR